MKKLKFIAIILVPIIITCCNPSAGLEPITEFVKVNATISDGSENITLGDTLQIKLTLPDSIVTNIRTLPLQSLQYGFFAMSAFKIDTANRRGIGITFPKIWASVGTMDNLSFELKKISKPYEVIINFKPTEKGLYRFEVVPQAGRLDFNGSIKTYLLTNFNVQNKHYNILSIIAPYFSGQAYYDAFVQRDSEGFGVYFFRVI